MAEIPCIILDGLTEGQKKAYLIADNKLALNAGWDEDLLRGELLDLKGLEFNLDLLGFNPEEMADLMLGAEVNQPEYDESAAADVIMVTCPECGHSFPK
jgi:ParB-like chromosome segregation protein Spo0J